MDTQTAKSYHLIILLIGLKDYIEREHEARIRRSHLALNVAGEYGRMTHRRRLQVRRDKSVSFICKWRMSNSANRRPQFSGTSFPAARKLPRGKSGVNNTPGESYFIEWVAETVSGPNDEIQSVSSPPSFNRTFIFQRWARAPSFPRIFSFSKLFILNIARARAKLAE